MLPPQMLRVTNPRFLLSPARCRAFLCMIQKPFPSVELLRTLSPGDRAFFFQMEYEDIKAEIAGLVPVTSGRSSPRRKKAGSTARMRLKELHKAAGAFQINL